jgi:hypothetical protein
MSPQYESIAKKYVHTNPSFLFFSSVLKPGLRMAGPAAKAPKSTGFERIL